MSTRWLVSIALLSSVALAANPEAPGAQKTPAKPAPARTVLAGNGPLSAAEAANGWSHAPYNEGDCSICHERKDPKNPGKIVGSVNELCYSCHEDFKEMISTKSKVHNPVKKDCTSCHNAHNARERKLLLGEQSALCLKCHETIKEDAVLAKVQHGPVIEGSKCANCHTPHASNVQSLLIALPFDLCVNCHSQPGLKDDKGVVLTNFKDLLGKNKFKHGPVDKKDCSACHQPHGGENFRMLLDVYPEEFYASYDPKNYALCFECHKSDIVKDAKTTTLTKFRDGDRNLHYLHVNKAERGRTCRGCHEVHAGEHAHIIRDSVPYGTRGWKLPVGFEQNANGGQCAKTCHSTKPYNNKSAAPINKAEAAPATSTQAKK